MTTESTTPTPAPGRPDSPGALFRWGRWVSRRHRWVALLWLVLLLTAGWLNNADKKAVSDNFRIPDTDSQAAYDLLAERFTSQNSATGIVVFSVPNGQRLTDPDNAAIVADYVAALDGVTGVVTPVSNPLVSDPSVQLAAVAASLPQPEAAAILALAPDLPRTVSADGRVAYTSLTFSDSITELIEQYPVNGEKPATDYPNPYRAVLDALAGVDGGAVATSVGGEIADTWNSPVSWWANHADEVGLALGALLLLIAFGSVFGMFIPIATALFGAVTASGLVFLLAEFTTVSSAAPPVTLMISIGVGLDYSLLIVTRYRQFVRDGRSADDAAGLAMASAGKAAVFAGLTVCIALLGLLLVPIPLVQTLGVAAAIGVAVMILAATTLLPALLGFAGTRIDRWRFPFSPRDGGDDPEASFWGRFAQRTARRPWFALIAGLAVLVILALPFLRIEFGMPDDSSLPRDLSQREAFVLVNDEFGPGVNGPLVVVVGLPESQGQSWDQTVAPVSKAVGALAPANTVPGVRYSIGPIPNDANDPTAVIYQLIPASAPDSAETHRLVDQLRADLRTATAGTDLQAHVGGGTATLIDLSSLVERYLPWVIGAVVLGAFLLLVLVFRSILVPLKAAAMNLVSIGAAYGVVVVVFQWGWARGMVGLSETIPIVSFVPLVMFVILFGLSMDYEVFLMSRIREEWDRTGDPRRSVVLGVANTARVITTAALIMIAVFASFVTNANPTVKLIGFGMAVAVLLDSTIVRMVLVPAVMELMGRRAWWFPSWLGWLPRLDIEGPSEPERTPQG